jgi:hypothetical protein
VRAALHHKGSDVPGAALPILAEVFSALWIRVKRVKDLLRSRACVKTQIRDSGVDMSSNVALIGASALSAIGAVLHGGLGESAILQRVIKTPLPSLEISKAFSFLAADTPEANTNLQWRYLRATWHLLTIDFLISVGLFAACVYMPSPSLLLMARITAGRYVAYAGLWLLVVAVHHRSVFRAPQWILLLAIAACVFVSG